MLSIIGLFDADELNRETKSFHFEHSWDIKSAES